MAKKTVKKPPTGPTHGKRRRMWRRPTKKKASKKR